MKKYLLLSAAALACVCACTNEPNDQEAPLHRGSKTIKAVLSETKSYLGDKDGTAYPNYWAAGDVININGVSSDPLDNSFNGKSEADFTIDGVSAPYEAVYPGLAVTNYAAGAVELTLPEVQNYVAGSYDPSAFIMLAKNASEGALAFEPQMALFKFTASGNANIKSVKLIASSAKKLSGPFGTDFNEFAALEGASNIVTLSMPEGGVAPGTPMIMVIPAGDYTDGIGVVFTDVNGGVMARRATPSKPYEAGKMYSTDIDYEAAILFCTADVLTSSSVVLNWSSVNPEDNINRAFDLMVYGDEACSNLLETYSIPANAACWNPDLKNWHLHFVIGGLSQGTQYWFKVKDKTDNSVSEACTATTTAFTPVAMPTADIATTGVVFAEDFSEYAWGWERITQAGGYIPADQSSLSNHSTEGATFTREETAANSGMRSTDLSTALTASRLDGWLSEGNTYYHPGYLKLGSDNNYGYALTPKFSIAEDNEATVDVTLTASRYGDDEYETWMVCVISNDGDKGGRQSDFVWPDETDPNVYREVEFANIGAEWKTVTVEGLKIGRDNRLAFGRIKGGDKTKARVYLSEIKVEVTEISEVIPALTAAEASGKTSSTLIFEWNGKKDHAFTATLYSDAACQNVVSSFDLPAETTSIWNKTNPTYVFGGLTPNTNYYFKVTDTSYSPAVESNVVAATTDEINIVQMPASISGTGVVLAEDFGEILWNADMVAKATGFVPSSTASFSDKDVANFVAGNSNSGEKKWSTVTAPIAASRLNGWSVDSNVYYHCGYLKMGTASAKGWILTPPFTVPDGKKAKVKVSVTAARYNSTSETTWAICVLNETEANMKTDYTASFYWPAVKTDENYQTVSLSGTAWQTVTAEDLEVYAGDRITFGPYDGSDNAKARIFVGDIKVEVTAVEDLVASPITAEAMEVSSSTLSFTWNEGGEAADDANLAYTATLYSDAGCSTPVLSYNFAAGQGSSLWRNKYPKFIFAGLSAGTQYYFRVTDGAGQVSNIVSAKTDAFTVVTMPALITETGVALAEDFSLFVWDFEYGQGCVGIAAPDSPTDFATRGSDPVVFSESVGNYQVFTSPAFASSRLNKWARDAGTDARMRVHPGYITMGSFSNNQKGWLLTPPFPVPEGKVATVTIKITARKGMTGATGDYAVGILNNSSNSAADGGGQNMKDENTSDFAWPNDRPETIYRTFTVNNDTSWQTFTYTGMTIKAGDRVVVGSRASYNYSSKKSCLNLSDITVTVTAIEDAE